MSVEAEVHKSVLKRLVDSGPLMILVPAGNILDRNARPAPDPSIIIGECQVVDEGDSIERSRLRVYMDLHIWKREEGLGGAKTIGAAIRYAIRSARLDLGTDLHCVDANVTASRYIRDPDGLTSHGIVTLSIFVQELT
jgi:hypothetical protein